jgi:nucleoside-diphosphate-sugar epimerase
MLNQKILVTGGAGFIGSNLIEELVKRGAKVKVIDNLSVSEENVPFLKKLGVEIFVEDISNFEKIAPLFKGIDGVIHLAAMNRAQRSIDDPLAANKSNIEGTINVLQASKINGIKKFINVSSSSVYGNSKIYPRIENNETIPPHPYAVGKLAGEHYTRVYNEIFGLNTLTLRFFSVFGPRQRPDISYAAVIPKFIDNIVHGKPIVVYGNGDQKRSFTFISDVVEGILLAYKNAKAKGETYNIAAPEEVSINELVNEIEIVTGKKAIIKYEPPLQADPEKNTVDITKARTKLGFSPKVSLREGLKEITNWLIENKKSSKN